MIRRIFQTSILIICLVVSQMLPGFMPTTNIKNDPNNNKIQEAEALGTFLATTGNLVTGSQTAITSGAATGNTGSWRGTFSNDNFTWAVDTNAVSGLNQQLTFGNVRLRNANTMIIQGGLSAGSASLNRFYQVCDWVSSSSVDNATDSECTGGGWRTLNKTDGSVRAAITNTTEAAFEWRIYNGYFTTSMTSNTTVSTPLTNFISGSNTVLVRAYSPTALATTHTIDYMQVSFVIESMTLPGGFTQVTGGSVTTGYNAAQNATFISGAGGTTGSDNIYLTVPGTAGAISDFYLTHKNVRTYQGANTILLSAETSCDNAVAPTYQAKIYNFTTASWTTLTSAITCSLTDGFRRVALSNITVTDYISNGEMRIGWVAASASIRAIRIDYQYVMVGSVNDDSSLCEITFGTGTATDCANTRTYDSASGSPSSWTLTSEVESATMSHDFYPTDNDADAVTGESAAASNLFLPVRMSPGMQMVALNYAFAAGSGNGSVTMRMAIRDLGVFSTASGWTEPTVNLSVSITYFDSFATGGVITNNSYNQLDTYNHLIQVRFRTHTSAVSTSFSPLLDFAFVAPRWVEDTISPRTTLRNVYAPTGGSLITGAQNAITSNAASGNTGSWRGLIGSTSFVWSVTSDATNGLNQELTFGNVALNGANKLVITVRALAGAATLSRVYQICDWVSSTSVDNAASNGCSGGGWRTLNKTNGTTRAGITATVATTYTWHVYDGYWTTSLTGNTPVSTPVSNFVSSGGNVLIRTFSSSAVAVTYDTSDALLEIGIDPVYFAGAFTQLAGGTVTTSYINTVNPPVLISGSAVTGSDNVYLSVPGTAGSPGDSYLSYNNIKTYSDMNAILVRSEYSCSAATAGLNLIPEIYNFTTTSWENLTSATIACSLSDSTQQFVKGGIDIDDYVSNGEARVRWRTSGNSTTAARLDLQYVMVGSVNANSSLCEISFGTGTATDCTNTRNYDSLGTPSVWTITRELESTTMSHDYYPQDNDIDANTGEAAVSVNLSYPVTLPDFTALATLGYAFAWQSGSTTMTTQWQVKDTAGTVGSTGGWIAFGTGSAAATYTYQDGITATPLMVTQQPYYDTVSNTINTRMRTTTSTLVGTANSLIDYAMIAPRWLEGPIVQSLSFSVSDNTIGFGTLSSSNARYATGDLLGNAAETEAHTLTASTNASSGYTITVDGTTLTSGGNTVDAIGGTNTASSAGTEQFGLRATASGGTGSVSAPYAASGFAFDTSALPDEVASQAVGDDTDTIYSLRYLANTATGTEAGSYSSVLTYTVTANY